MSLQFIIQLGIATLASFLGALPFGTVNLSVVDTTLRKSFRDALLMCVGASIAEILWSLIAVHCSAFISENIEGNAVVAWSAVGLFLVIGAFFWFKKSTSQEQAEDAAIPKKKKLRMGPFPRGAFLALINPQALPFWVFIITYLQVRAYVTLDTAGFVAAFLGGVWLGKLLALLVFAYAAVFIQQRIAGITKIMNKIIGSVLWAIALFQALKLVGLF